MSEHVRDERLTAPAVREWSHVRESRTQRYEDRVAVARHLYLRGMPTHEIADVVGMDWAQVDWLLAGLP